MNDKCEYLSERKQDEYVKELWNKIRQKERRVMELEAERDSLREALQNIGAGKIPDISGVVYVNDTIKGYVRRTLRDDT